MRIDPEKLRTTRLRMMLTQQELAEKSGTTEATVNRIERGLQEPRISTIRELARALDVDPKSLMTWDETPATS